MNDSPKTYSLKRRLAVWFTSCSFILIAIYGAISYWQMTAVMEREDDEQLKNRFRSIKATLESGDQNIALLKAQIEHRPVTGHFTETLIRILDKNGGVIAETFGMSEELPQSKFSHALPLAGSDGQEIRSKSGNEYHVMSIVVLSEVSSAEGHVIQIGMNRTYENEFLEEQRISLAIFLAVAFVVCALVGSRIASRGLTPVTNMIATVQRIRSTTLEERVDSRGAPVELYELAATFNDMMDRLEDAFRRVNQFSSNIAHELRSPVNILRGEIEVALGQPRSSGEYHETLTSALEECARLSKVIDALLFLSRAEDPATQIVREEVDVENELKTVKEFYDAAAADRGIEIHLQCAKSLKAKLDPTLFHRAVANLISNALDHTPPAGEIVVTATMQSAPQELSVAVQDNGSGIPPESLPHVFDRFFRHDTSRSGASERFGLGLAIVKSIAILHQGRVEAAASIGKGTKITIYFGKQNGI